MASALLTPSIAARTGVAQPVQQRSFSTIRPRRQSSLVVRAEGKGDEKATGGKNEPLYADQIKPRPSTKMSPEMQKKLRDEYLGFGGSANTAMGANYFLYIILGVSFLAVLSWLAGAI